MSPKVEFKVLPRLARASSILSPVVTEAYASLQSNTQVHRKAHARQRCENSERVRAQLAVTTESDSRWEAHASPRVNFKVRSAAHASLQVDSKVRFRADASPKVNFKVRSGLA